MDDKSSRIIRDEGWKDKCRAPSLFQLMMNLLTIITRAHEAVATAAVATKSVSGRPKLPSSLLLFDLTVTACLIDEDWTSIVWRYHDPNISAHIAGMMALRQKIADEASTSSSAAGVKGTKLTETAVRDKMNAEMSAHLTNPADQQLYQCFRDGRSLPSPSIATIIFPLAGATRRWSDVDNSTPNGRQSSTHASYIPPLLEYLIASDHVLALKKCADGIFNRGFRSVPEILNCNPDHSNVLDNIRATDMLQRAANQGSRRSLHALVLTCVQLSFDVTTPAEDRKWYTQRAIDCLIVSKAILAYNNGESLNDDQGNTSEQLSRKIGELYGRLASFDVP
jgi:hypothetical protein